MITRHMNAVKAKTLHLDRINPDEWLMEEKFKGIRCWYKKEDGKVSLITRGLEDVTENFPHLAEDRFPDISDLQLDCELFDPSQEDEVVSGWAFTKEILPSVTEGCVLKVFDLLHIYDAALQNTMQITRKRILDSLKLSGPLQKVPYFDAKSQQDYYEFVLDKGGEGIMLKNKYTTYVEGARKVSHWLKRKKRDLYDVIIVGYTEAKPGKFTGLIGSLKVGMYFNGVLREISAVSGMSDSWRIEFTNNPERYINRVCSVHAASQDRNTFSLIEPSFYSLRVDKTPSECTYNPDAFDPDFMVDLD